MLPHGVAGRTELLGELLRSTRGRCRTIGQAVGRTFVEHGGDLPDQGGDERGDPVVPGRRTGGTAIGGREQVE